MTRWILLFLFLPFSLNAAPGISFGPGEIIYNNLQIGQEYDFGVLSNIPFEVQNKSDVSITVQIVKYAPSPGDVKKGYEPVPDLDWISLTQNTIKDIGPGEKRTVSLKIKVPDNKKFLGKKFQVMLQARTTAGNFMSLGANSRVLFTMSETRDQAKNKLPEPPARFKVGPEKIEVQDLVLGTTNTSSRLTVHNMSKKTMKFAMTLMNGRSAGRRIWAGYLEFPAISLVVPTKNYFTVQPGKRTDVGLKLFLENKKEYQGKKYQFFVDIHTVDEEVVEEFYLPILIELRSEKKE
jgi:hypothetical protein